MVRVKICGNTSAEHVGMCVEAGADCLGFVVEYPVPVPWNLSRQRARELMALAPPMVSLAVVTGGEPERVLEIARFLSPHFVQLHTDNRLEETALMARELGSLGIRLVRALRIDVTTGQASGPIKDPIEAATALAETGIAAILLDARTADMPAGTGASVDWQLALAVRRAIRLPLVLAGGLTPANIRRAVETVRPYAVDVITGTEVSRTVKDPWLVREFVARAKGHRPPEFGRT